MRTACAALTAVSKRYGRAKALEACTFAVFPGEAVVLLGPNGSGKSTALHVLLGIVRPDSGNVLVFGESPQADVVKGRLGCQLQTTSLYPTIHVDEALDLFGSYYPRRRDTEELMEAFGIASYRHRQFRSLSGGIRQRLALALAFINQPDLVVLDEPSAALDTEARRRLWALVREHKLAGRSAVVATHSASETRAIADRVIVLNQGQVVRTGVLGSWIVDEDANRSREEMDFAGRQAPSTDT